MGKLSQAQRDALEYLYDLRGFKPRMTTLASLANKGFVEFDCEDVYMTSFGVNVVKMMRGEMRRR